MDVEIALLAFLAGLDTEDFSSKLTTIYPHRKSSYVFKLLLAMYIYRTLTILTHRYGSGGPSGGHKTFFNIKRQPGIFGS